MRDPRDFVTRSDVIVGVRQPLLRKTAMHYSHQNTQLRYNARVNDITRLHSSDGLIPRLVRSFRKR